MRVTTVSLWLLAVGCVADTVGLDGLQLVTIQPKRIDFDGPGVPCGTYTRPITITNGTDIDLTIQSVVVAGGSASAFTVDAPAPNTTLSPRGSLSFDVTFFATIDGLYEDVVVVTAVLAGMPMERRVIVRGLIAEDGTHEDNFTQRDTADADILFVVDNSCSMLPEHAALRRSFASFIQIANSGLLDYHIAVTTTDVSRGDVSAEGRFVPLMGSPTDRVVTRASLPSPLEHFARNANVGTEGSGEERGIHAAHLALTGELLDLHNFGFLREHTLLSIIFVADEEDQSPDELDFYERFFASKRDGDRSRVTVSAIVGDSPRGCSGVNGTAKAAPRYTAMVDRFSGVVESICTENWGLAMSRLSSVAFGLIASFPLSAKAIANEIVVEVNGAVVERTDSIGRVFWRYEPRTNAVVFEPRAIPGPGAAVHIEYGTACLL